MPRKDQPEFRLQCAIADLLRLTAKPGVYWTALPFGEKRTLETGARLKRMGVRAGAGDVLLLVNSRAVMLELKVPKGRQTESQRITERDWTVAKGLYHVARSFSEARDFLEMIGAINPSLYSIRHQQEERA
jgi:hypothetical protein